MRVLGTTIFALAISTTTTQARKKPSDAVLLSNIKTLTLHGGRQTTARRGPAVPQLDCVGGNAKGLHNVDVMRCTNAGSDYGPEDVQWTCQASLPSEFKLGSTEVVCEGYDSAEDPYVLKGSCGVEYRLVLTEAGERKYGERYDYGQDEYGRVQKKGGLGEKLFTFVFWAIFLGEYHLLFASYEISKLTAFCYRYRRPNRPLNMDRRRRWQWRRSTTRWRWRLGRRRRRMGRRWRRRPRRPTSSIFFFTTSL